MTYTKEQLREELNTMELKEVEFNDVIKLEEYKDIPSDWKVDDSIHVGHRLEVISVNKSTSKQTNQIYHYKKIQDHLVVFDKNKGQFRLYGKFDDYLRIGFSNMAASILLNYFPTQYYFVPKEILIKRLREKEKQ